MSHILAARFQTFDAAQAGADMLASRGILRDDIDLFYVNPAGRHDRYPLGGDRAVDPNAGGGAVRAWAGSVVVAVVFALVGLILALALRWSWIVVVLFAAAGAYIGSLQGAMSGLPGRARRESALRPDGVLLAVRNDNYDANVTAALLTQAGGVALEQAEGDWQSGHWKSFDPLQPEEPVTVDSQHAADLRDARRR